MKYKPRIADDLLKLKLEAFGAVLIKGPKGCGKTTTAKQIAKSYIEFQDENLRDNYLTIADVSPSRLLDGEKPRLFDEWQDAPKIWGAIRKEIDDTGEKGMFILTGSSSRDVKTAHSGTLRIANLDMLPMSLWESEESNGTVSLKELFSNGKSFESCQSDLTLDQLIFAMCRGGWPSSLNVNSDSGKLEIAKELFRQICNVDAYRIDEECNDPMIARGILTSYARNIATLATSKTIHQDASGYRTFNNDTFYKYLNALEKLYIIQDIEAWSPAIRSKTAVRSSRKRNLIDPSLACAILGLAPEYFNNDFKTLGFLFESLCIRDLKAYTATSGGSVSYYRDRYQLEADAVLHLDDGRYALVEFKLGGKEIDKGIQHLNEIESLIKEYNINEKQVPLPLPTLKLVITATAYGYRANNDVLVVPIGCLKD